MLHRLIALVAVAFSSPVRNRIADHDRQRGESSLDRGFFGIDLLQLRLVRLVRLVRFFIEQFKRSGGSASSAPLRNHRQGIR